MFIVKDGYIYVGVSLVLAAIVYYFFGAYWAVIPVVLALYFAYFFRDFHRSMPYDPNILYSPADGTVMGIEEIFDDEYLNEPALKLTIFLSVFNVHTNRAPLDGEIKYQRYTCGQFVPAYEKNASFENERHAVGVDNGRIRFLVIQVAGLLARRIVSWVTVGHELKQGETYGMIKFGSSTELIVPKNVEITVKKGDKVTGGITVVGRVKAE
ncbi:MULTISPECIES: phosphatidylserine decarboxylase [Phascolarctobacterium]|jgi:phosphatidylserine decarboxylase|uniref:phosphatidylserine decarboxylase n=1 Tax=Phascolarctobacterium TaxID=33024 RepID=UPI0025FE465D|nr:MULTISPECIES: phosphatidylserine decarboxylase [Phascolarctobacterium]